MKITRLRCGAQRIEGPTSLRASHALISESQLTFPGTRLQCEGLTSADAACASSCINEIVWLVYFSLQFIFLEFEFSIAFCKWN